MIASSACLESELSSSDTVSASYVKLRFADEVFDLV